MNILNITAKCFGAISLFLLACTLFSFLTFTYSFEGQAIRSEDHNFNKEAFLGFIVATLSMFFFVGVIMYVSFTKHSSVKLFGLFLTPVIVPLTLISIAAFLFFSQTYINGIFHTKVGPILTWGIDKNTSTSIYVLWGTSTATYSLVEYWPKNGSHDYATSEGTSYWHKICIDNLQPNTQYFYRVPTLGQELHTFYTPPVKEEQFTNFTILVFADPRQNSGPEGILFQPSVPEYMDTEKRAFVISAGDTTDYADNWMLWQTWWRDLSESNLGVNTPIAFAPGNHERGGGLDCESRTLTYYMPPKARPNGLFYQSFDYQNVHLTIVDPWNYHKCKYWGWDGFDDVQKEWIRQDILNANSSKFKIVALHPPPIREELFGPDELVFESNYEVLDEMTRAGLIDAFFYGHKHSFNYEKHLNTWFVRLGIGGNRGHDKKTTGYATVDFSKNQMDITMNFLDGRKEFIGSIIK